MSRNINPAPQYTYTDPITGVYGPVREGQMYYFKSGTNTPLVTYKDQLQSIPNTHPVLLDSDGRIPNVFFEGSAKQILLDQNDVQIFSRDPVGGEKELGDFQLWDTVVTYDINDIVETSSGSLYISLSNDNQGNDPETSPDKWNEIRLLGLWNTNINYAIGDVVQISTGELYRAVTVNASNDPAIDDGTNWLPAINGDQIPEVITLKSNEVWKLKNTDFTAVARESYQIDASANTVSVTLPVIAEGDVFTIHNESISTFTVLVLNPSYSIKGPNGTIAAGTDLELVAGDTAVLVAKSATILEVV